MSWSIQEIASELQARLSYGPFRFRLIMQPATAIILGLIDGNKDATAGVPPFIYQLMTKVGGRVEGLRIVLRRLFVPICVAITLDCVVQFMMFGHVRPLIALIFGTALMCLPYSASRALSNRFFWSRRVRRRGVDGHSRAAGGSR